MPRLRAVVFDLFGTLVPKWPQEPSRRCVEAMADMLGVGRERFAQRWTETFDDREHGRHASMADGIAAILADLGHPVDDRRIEHAADLRYRLHARRAPPRPSSWRGDRAGRAA